MNNELLINDIKSNNSEIKRNSGDCKNCNSHEKQQIEEMAKIVAVARGYGCAEQDRCDMSCQVCKVGCIPHEDAQILYTAGYRKQSEGEWISNRQTGEYICNLCGGIAPVDCEKEDFYKSNYCPNCGAKMKGGAE